MAEFNDTGYKTFQAGLAITQHLRVALSSGKLAIAGITDNDIGTVTRATFADLDQVAVALRTKPGTVKMVASAAIAAGVLVYTAASGKISSTAAATSFLRGRALDAASGDNSIIEVLPMFARTAEI